MEQFFQRVLPPLMDGKTHWTRFLTHH